ncbi:MAG: protein-L-isoaspartate O-methyltransferase [Deltaproteobacteria bacterium HGW-Deltaproteobacteria-14]|jgi:protein-L-isoaspartate(D-aspartate) O-methyltransferase|nr:MAG: protein-L-isoaspartate O-methyltransferase [Deltaproteobacteria bacterium HGW-Deltaproteobacteria-14]
MATQDRSHHGLMPGESLVDLDLETMISQQLVGRGITDQRVLAAFRRVPRKAFVPDYLHQKTYLDVELPIGLGQTISPPYIAARMLQELRLPASGAGRVLEVGTGSGFQTALLATIAQKVVTIEIAPELSARARKLLVDDLGIHNVEFHVGDGFNGWSESAPFDGIVVNAAAEDEAPWPLIGQLRDGARLVIPIGERGRELQVILRKDMDEVMTVLPLGAFAGRFTMLKGEAEEE